MFEKWKQEFAPVDFQKELERLRARVPVPVFWLFGKTQSGKTSVIKYLTNADDAEIGKGWKPCTRFSRAYDFPSSEIPLIRFLDTRGLEEAGYDPAEDIEAFSSQTHVLIVTVKAMDHAQETVVNDLKQIRKRTKGRPVLLVFTCLHEAYPGTQHPQPYPFDQVPLSSSTTSESALGNGQAAPGIDAGLAKSLAVQRERFAGLYEESVAVDLTPPEEGFTDPQYGGPQLKQVLLSLLPSAYRQSLVDLDEVNQELRDLYARRALPYILGYAGLGATAGAIPIPWLDLLILPGIQTRMITHLAQLYGQPLDATRFMEIAGTMGIGILARTAVREVVKFIPIVGSIAGGALGGATTYALGKAFCYYYSKIHQGHVPQADELKRYYNEQLAAARKHWFPANMERRPTPH